MFKRFGAQITARTTAETPSDARARRAGPHDRAPDLCDIRTRTRMMNGW